MRSQRNKFSDNFATRHGYNTTLGVNQQNALVDIEHIDKINGTSHVAGFTWIRLMKEWHYNECSAKPGAYWIHSTRMKKRHRRR